MLGDEVIGACVPLVRRGVGFLFLAGDFGCYRSFGGFLGLILQHGIPEIQRR
jgi:hypothetical protein